MKSMMFLFVFIITQNLFANTMETMPDGSTLAVRLIGEAPATLEEMEQQDRLAREQCSASTQKRIDLQGLITLGKEIWQIVKDGAPVVNFKNESASVIPQGALCPFSMSQWSLPMVKTFELNYKNKFGMEMIYFTYKVIYSYGGMYQGKGAYLANVSIHPKDIRLKWGQSFDANVKIASALNMGTVENPIAGLEISLDWVIQNPIMDTQSNRTYFVDGLGNLVAL
jgi:hypothetical protein